MTRWIVAACEAELAQIKAELDALMSGMIAGSPHSVAHVGSIAIHLGVVGIGVVSAAVALAAFLTTVPADNVIMVGSAGAFPGSDLSVGDVAVASSETLAELGLCSGRGVADGDALNLGLEQTVSLDQRLCEGLLASARELFRARSGPFLSVAGVSDTEAQAKARSDRFPALVENMEGYALALAGRRFGIPVGEVRGVSNLAGVRDKSAWNLDLAGQRAQAAVLQFLRRKV